MTEPDFSQAACRATLALFRRVAPDAAETVAPFLPRLFQALADGHTFITLERHESALLRSAAPIVGNQGDTPLIVQQDQLFIGRIWQLEHDLAHEIIRIARSGIAPPDDTAPAKLQEWFSQANSQEQQAAAALALLQNFMLISGGPGTGKTTTVAKLLALLCLNAPQPPRIALAAPTGKAAAHMAAALHRALGEFLPEPAIRQHLAQLEGQTVHRLLKLVPPRMRPRYDGENPLPLDILLVDEASMLDNALLLDLLRAVPSGCKVILLGDENQLPSVGIGAILTELAQPTALSPATAQLFNRLLPQHSFPVSDAPPPLAENIARLNYSHRFHEQSGIGCLAKAVIAGDAETAWAQFARFPEELSVLAASPAEQHRQLYALQQAYWQAIAEQDIAAAFKHQNDIVVLCAQREDAQQFNHQYRRFLQKQGHILHDTGWFAGQMIMITRNDYANSVFNGDIGIILPEPNTANSSQAPQLAAFFPAADGHRRLPLSRLPEHEDAFALTVHKSQGSEYRRVWLLPPQHSAQMPPGFNRALLYTAITRAREQFVFCGSHTALSAACQTNPPRRSALRRLINEAAAQYAG